MIAAVLLYKATDSILYVRAWTEDARHTRLSVAPAPTDSRINIRDEEGVLIGTAVGAADPIGPEYVQFAVSVQLAAEHAYRAELRISLPLEASDAIGHLPMPTVR